MTTITKPEPGKGLTGQPHDRIRRPVESQVSRDHVSIARTDPPPPDVTLTQKMLSAVSGSVFTSFLVTPLDVVRVRLQSQQNTSNKAGPQPSISPAGARSFNNLPANLGVTACCREVFWVNNNAEFCVAGSGSSNMAFASNDVASNAECSMQEAQKKQFSSTFDGMRKIARNEGLSTLWRGLSPTLLMAVPGNVIYFAGYDWLRTSSYSPIKDRIGDLYAPLVAGSSARVFAALFVSPIELFRTRMQASHGSTAAANFWETFGGVQDMVKSQGLHTLWRGLTLTLWRDVPFSALYWWGYEATRNLLTEARDRTSHSQSSLNSGAVSRRRADSRSRQNHTTTLLDSFIAGATSGAVASVVTTPFDVGKTRQQVYRHSGDAPASSAAAESASQVLRPEQQSMPRLLWDIFKEGGTVGLFRGWIPRVMKVAPACAIMISSYEIGKKMAQGVQEKDET